MTYPWQAPQQSSTRAAWRGRVAPWSLLWATDRAQAADVVTSAALFGAAVTSPLRSRLLQSTMIRGGSRW